MNYPIMRSFYLIIISFIFSLSAFAQHEAKDKAKAMEEILKFQQELTHQFKDTAESPLPRSEVSFFVAHDFFPVDLKYRVVADLILTPDAPEFEMPTTTSRKPLYKQYAFAVFIINSVSYTLSLYQSVKLSQQEEYEDYLFLPYKDFTNGIDTYGGGRYIDLRKPDGDKITIDFNQSYNPYCAYNARYSCPIPPDRNQVPRRIEAGIKLITH